MQDNKIAIIAANYKNDAPLYASLSNIEVPAGFKLDIIKISGKESIAKKYNTGMRKSKARYKVYIDERVAVLQRDFLARLVNIFAADPHIGITGTSGTKQIPVSGICQAAKQRVGRLAVEAEGKIIEFGEINDEYEKVMAADGFLLATQYDVPWREDLFAGDSFYDTAQCAEFRRRGYDTVVVRQDDNPWVWFRENEMNIDDEACQVFLDEYSKDIFPLVSVVIPAYNRPDFLKDALESVLNQTYRNLEVFITDNTHSTIVKDFMQPYLEDKRVIYEHHPEFDMGGNWGRAISYNNDKAEYVNWLMHDDYFAPKKLERMMQMFFDYPQLSLVTSYRQMVDEQKNNLPPVPANMPLAENDCIFNGEAMGRKIMTECLNTIGEPSTVLVKKSCMNNNRLGWTGKEGKYLISDFPTWLCCLSKGDMGYIREPLSFFRRHEGQQQHTDNNVNNSCWICWAMEMEYAWENKIFLHSKEDYIMAAASWLRNSGLLNLTVEAGETTVDLSEDETMLLKKAINMVRILVYGQDS